MRTFKIAVIWPVFSTIESKIELINLIKFGPFRATFENRLEAFLNRILAHYFIIIYFLEKNLALL